MSPKSQYCHGYVKADHPIPAQGFFLQYLLVHRRHHCILSKTLFEHSVRSRTIRLPCRWRWFGCLVLCLGFRCPRPLVSSVDVGIVVSRLLKKLKFCGVCRVTLFAMQTPSWFLIHLKVTICITVSALLTTVRIKIIYFNILLRYLGRS